MCGRADRSAVRRRGVAVSETASSRASNARCAAVSATRKPSGSCATSGAAEHAITVQTSATLTRFPLMCDAETLSTRARPQHSAGTRLPCRAALRLYPQQPRRVAPEHRPTVLLRDVEASQALQHRRNAADAVGIVAPGENLARPGELQGELQRPRIEVHRVVEELLQVGAGRAPDVLAALRERLVPAIQPLGEIRDRAAEMPQDPADA